MTLTILNLRFRILKKDLLVQLAIFILKDPTVLRPYFTVGLPFLTKSCINFHINISFDNYQQKYQKDVSKLTPYVCNGVLSLILY